MCIMIFGSGLFATNRTLSCLFSNFFHLTKPKAEVVHSLPFKFCRLFLSPHKPVIFSKTLCSTILRRKIYHKEHENLSAHEVLENIASYVDTVVPHPMKIIQREDYNRQISKSEIFEKFSLTTFDNLKHQRTLGEAEFTNLVCSLVQNIPNANFNDIQLVLFCLCLWPQCATTFVPNFKLLWNTLDSKCTKQLKNWSIAQKLLIADYWFHLNLSRISIYNTSMINDLISHGDELTNTQFVQLLFCINLQRNIPQELLDTVMKKLEIAVNAVSLEELSIICLGYFKTENKVNNGNILKVILKRTTSDIDNLNPITLVRILKFLRNSFQNYAVVHYRHLLRGCTVNIERWNLLTAVHVSLLSTRSYIFEPSLLDTIVEKMKDNIPDARLKDISRIVQCLSQFNYMPHSQFHEILFKEMMKADRLKEGRKFPRDLLQLLLFYAYMGQYPLDLIAHVLSQDFVEHCQRSAANGPSALAHLAVLDQCIEMEGDGYFGPRLKSHFLSVLQSGRSISSIKDHENCVLEQLTKNVMKTLNRVITPDKYVLRHVLPHMFNPDIIVRLSSKNSVPLKQIVDACPPENFLRPPPDELWGCLIMCGPFAFPFQSKRLCGLLAMKERHLRKLGYKTLLISYKDFFGGGRYREIYLKKKLDSLQMNNPASLTVEMNS